MNVDNNIYEFPDAKGIVVSGDIHGDYEKLVYKCCLQCQMTDTLIIVAGDCGFGFNKPGYYDAIYQKVSSRLAKANNWIVFIRGNHDNPAYFDGQQVNYKRWKAVPDYSVIKACGHTILCIGGAISIDRGWRMYENSKRFPGYGTQRGWERITVNRSSVYPVNTERIVQPSFIPVDDPDCPW